MDNIVSEQQTYFISGHVDISQEDFNKYYRDKIMEAVSNPNSMFVVGNAPGADIMAQYLLIDLLKDDNGLDRICVYHCGSTPSIIADTRLKTIGGFKTHEEKDRSMTLASNIDIAYVRSHEDSKKLYGKKFRPNRISGTQKNLDRRASINNINLVK